MRGFRFRSLKSDPREKPNTPRPVANEMKLPSHARKKPLVPRVGDTAPKGPTG